MTIETQQKIDQERKRRMESAPISVRGLLKRVFDGKSPRSGCIKAMCLECIGFDRAAITECTSYACPLWNVRPFQKKGAVEETIDGEEGGEE